MDARFRETEAERTGSFRLLILSCLLSAVVGLGSNRRESITKESSSSLRYGNMHSVYQAFKLANIVVFPCSKLAAHKLATTRTVSSNCTASEVCWFHTFPHLTSVTCVQI